MNRTTLVILQGATWTMSWPIRDENGEPLDLTGWVVRGQVRPSLASSEVYHEFSTEAGNARVEDSHVRLSISAAESANWDWSNGVYDLELLDPTGRVARIAEGDVILSPEVTR